MLLDTVRFLDIVEKQTEKQNFFLFQSLICRGKDSFAAGEPLRMFDGDQRVRIRGIIMVNAVLKKSNKVSPFRNIFSKNVEVVHHRQRRRNVGRQSEDVQKYSGGIIRSNALCVEDVRRAADRRDCSLQ